MIKIIENNSLKLTVKIAKELFNNQLSGQLELWDKWEDVVDSRGLLTFDNDNCFKWDYLTVNESLVNLLKKHKVKGRVLFSTIEPNDYMDWDFYDIAFWGHEFDGKGNHTQLIGWPNPLIWLPISNKLTEYCG